MVSLRLAIAVVFVVTAVAYVTAWRSIRRAYWMGYAAGMRRGRQAAGDGRVTVERDDNGGVNVTVEVDMRDHPR